MFIGKKGLEKRIVVGYAIGIVAGLIVIIGIALPFADAAGNTLIQGALTDLCEFNSGLKNSLSSDNPASGLLKDNAPLPFCFDKRRTVDATAWKKCDPDGLYGLKDDKNRQRARTTCAAIQVAKLAKTCFDMYGSDKWNLRTYEDGTYPCFSHIKIKHLGKNFMTEADFMAAMNLLGQDNGFCGKRTKDSHPYFNNNDCWSDKGGTCEVHSDGKTYRCSGGLCMEIRVCGSSDINNANADNVIWAGDLFSDGYAKEIVKVLEDYKKQLERMMPEISDLQSKINGLNFGDQNARNKLHSRLAALHKKYTNYRYGNDPLYAGDAWQTSIDQFKTDNTGRTRANILNMLTTMSNKIQEHIDSTVLPNIQLYSKGNLMCFDECGGETLAGVLGGLGCSEFEHANGKYGTDAVKINDVNKPKSLPDPVTKLFTVDYNEGCKI